MALFPENVRIAQYLRPATAGEELFVETVLVEPGRSNRAVIGARLGLCDTPIFSVTAQAALDSALLRSGIPTLTAPYVLVMWLFLLPKGDLAPHPCQLPVGGGIWSASL